MFTTSIRVVTLIGVMAFASHAATIGVSGTDCGGDPPITTNTFRITADEHGDFCDAFTNDLPDGPSGVGGSGTPITSLTFQSDLAAGTLATDYNCTTDIFTDCSVSVDAGANLLTVSFWDRPFIGTVDVRGPFGVPQGGSFNISLENFTAFQAFDVGVNSPEPGTLLLLGSVALLCLMRHWSTGLSTKAR